jgi:ribose-phosphate pyrophosphokinase
MTLFLAMPGNDRLAKSLASDFGDVGNLETRRFPDGETYLRYATIPGGNVALVATLSHPDDKILPLVFAAATARELGARQVGLVAPYLAYMRQDRRFKPGEAVTSRHFAKLISSYFDWLVTVDPHLHRYSSLGEIYAIPNRVVHAAPLISEWIRRNISAPLIVGPDSESEQWVAAVAKAAGAPYAVLDKDRRGDRDVEVSIRDNVQLDGRTPIFVDDIISSGRTMLAAVKLVASAGAKPICIALHGLFADDSATLLMQAGARVVTSNTVPHATNDINVEPLLSAAVRELVE